MSSAQRHLKFANSNRRGARPAEAVPSVQASNLQLAQGGVSSGGALTAFYSCSSFFLFFFGDLQTSKLSAGALDMVNALC